MNTALEVFWVIMAVIFLGFCGAALWVGFVAIDRAEVKEYQERQIKVRQRPPLYDHERRGDFSGPRKFQLRVNECGHTWGRTHDGLCQGCGADWEQVHA